MKFFHPVNTFSNTGKTAKGRALQGMALQFDRVLIHGDNSAMQLMLRIRELAAVIDAKYPRTRRTFVELHIDDQGNGMITASPVSDSGSFEGQDYFRITFNTVAHAATIDEVIDKFTLASIEKGGDWYDWNGNGPYELSSDGHAYHIKEYQMPKDAKSAIYVPGKEGGDK